MNKDILPQWVKDHLPKKKKSSILSYEENKWKITHVNNEVDYYDDLKDAYDNHCALGKGILFDESVKNSSKYNVFLSFEDENNVKTLFLEQCDDSRELKLNHGYRDFLSFTEMYILTHMNDFYYAWNFLNTHPAFWRAVDLNKNPWAWEQDNYMEKITYSVFKTEINQTMFYMTAGAINRSEDYTGKLFNSYNGDSRLEVESSTFENAVIEIAKKVFQIFDLEGLDVKPNVISNNVDETLARKRLEEIRSKY